MGESSLWRNIMVNVDSYKNAHYGMYPDGTEYVSSYVESRGGRFPAFRVIRPVWRSWAGEAAGQGGAGGCRTEKRLEKRLAG